MTSGTKALLGLMIGGLVGMGTATPALAQEEPRQAVTLDRALASIDRPEPAATLGIRAATIKRFQRVIPTVVVVDDHLAAAEVIAQWAGLARWPVLIDDGSVDARENIARFVRAFQPEEVVRWNPASPIAWPGGNAPRAEREAAVFRFYGRTLSSQNPPTDARGAIEIYQSFGITPHGLVAVDATDPVWVAGLALAAGRLQPMIFIEKTGQLNGAAKIGPHDAMVKTIQDAATGTGLTWRGIGDDIDALTVVANTAGRVTFVNERGRDQEMAFTDLVIRTNGWISTPWAWAGLIGGSPQKALYDAMCGLFLPMDSAWLFDGYTEEEPWNAWDMTKTAEIFETREMDVRVFDTPSQDLAMWRNATAPGIGSDLVMLNSKGRATFFDLEPGRAGAEDIAPFRMPVAMHIVHSWSAQQPTRIDTVAGRFRLHGAYAYFGSVREPFLDAFVPSPAFAARLSSGWAFGAAARNEKRPSAWRLQMLGDPLLTLAGPADCGGRVTEIDLPIAGTRSMEQAMRAALRDKRYGEGLELLVMLGRDEEAGRLAETLMRSVPEAFDGRAAAAAVMPLYRSGKFREAILAYGSIAENTARNTMLRDTIWHSARIALPTESDEEMERVLARYPRSPDHDIDVLLNAVRERSGPSAAALVGDIASANAANPHQAKVIREKAEALRKGGGG